MDVIRVMAEVLHRDAKVSERLAKAEGVYVGRFDCDGLHRNNVCGGRFFCKKELVGIFRRGECVLIMHQVCVDIMLPNRKAF